METSGEVATLPAYLQIWIIQMWKKTGSALQLLWKNITLSSFPLYLHSPYSARTSPSTMAAALQSSFTSLNLGTSSFLGQRVSPSLHLPLVKLSEQPPSSITAKLKRWERKECKPNSLPVLHKMHVKLGDTVKVISGKDKGKVGEVSRIITHNSSIVIKDINLKTKHVKSKGEDEPGQIIKIEAPIHSSNVMLYSKDQNVVSRVGHKTLDNGKRVRYLIKTGEVIDSAENWKRVAKEKEKTTELAAAS